MYRVTLPALLLLVPLCATAEPKTLRVPAEYPTLAEAVDAAAPGDTIALAAGRHPLPARLVITKPVQIRGESAEATIIQTTLAKDEAVMTDKVDGLRVEKVAFEYTGAPQPEGRTDFPSLLSIVGGRAEVTDCAFRRSSGFGLIVKGGAKALVRHCRAENNTTIGIFVKEPETSVTLTDNDADKNGSAGITVSDNAQGAVEGNRCAENGDNGILVSRAISGEMLIRANICDKNRKNGIRACLESKVRIEGNTCRENVEGGVAADTGSTGTVTGNTCTGSPVGVIVRSVGTDIVAEKNRCSSTLQAGLGVFFGAKALFRDNDCTEGSGAGIWASGWESTADVTGNRCNGNKDSGVYVDQGGHANIRGNECVQNARWGIFVSDEESGADIGENTLKDNTKGESTTEKGKSGKYQYQVRPYEIAAAFMRGHVDYLERVVARLRKYQSRYDTGSWQLYFFYDGLLHGTDGFNMHKRPDFRIALEKWASEHPDSPTPRIALAQTHLEYGWEARGTGWASQVTPEGWKGLREHLDTAVKWCEEAELKPEKDPVLYGVWIGIAKGRSAPKSEVRSLLEKGMAIDPSYHPMYQAACETLWPRWGGSREEIQEFFSMVHDRTKEQLGEKMYACLVDTQFCPGAVYGDLADWSLLQQGYGQLVEEFPQSSYYLNRYCLMACVFGDKEKARALFERIGDNPNTDAWVYKQDNFTKAKRWALSNGPLPDFFRVDGRPPGNADEHVSPPVPAVVSALAGLTRKKIAMGLLAASLGVALITVLVILLVVRASQKRT